MTGLEWLVIVGGGLGGYGLVSFLLQGKAPITKASTTTGPEANHVTSPSAPAAIAWYDTLGVPADADAATIRLACKHMIGQYHPDKVATLGPELQALATRKSQDIAEAYRSAMRSRGETS